MATRVKGEDRQRIAFLTEEQEALREEVRRFVENECPQAEVRELDHKGEFPERQWQKLGRTGWLAAALPEEMGGAGCGVVEQAIVTEELSRASASLGIAYFSSNCFGINAVLWHGSEVIKQRYLPGLGDGTIRVAGSFTEPDGGSDLLALRSRATRTKGGWRLRGHKVYTTGAGHAQAAITVFRTSDPGAKRHEGLTEFIVPLDLPGIEIRRMATMGVHSIGTFEIYYNDVELPDDAVLGEPDHAWYNLVKTFNNERLLGAAWAVGNATRAIDEAVRFANEREAFGRTIGHFQAIQHTIAKGYAWLQAARLAVYNAALSQERGGDAVIESLIASYTGSEAGFSAAHAAMRVLGGQGYTEEESVERTLRDAHVAILGPSTNEMVLNILAERLGMPKSY
jgi:alkylation response protein AidB-like acyl-CoA dehydrogenase